MSCVSMFEGEKKWKLNECASVSMEFFFSMSAYAMYACYALLPLVYFNADHFHEISMVSFVMF